LHHQQLCSGEPCVRTSCLSVLGLPARISCQSLHLPRSAFHGISPWPFGGAIVAATHAVALTDPGYLQIWFHKLVRTMLMVVAADAFVVAAVSGSAHSVDRQHPPPQHLSPTQTMQQQWPPVTVSRLNQGVVAVLFEKQRRCCSQVPTHAAVLSTPKVSR
jgi:hypothetical protein